MDGPTERHGIREMKGKNLHEFVYSLPVACLISGCESTEQIDQSTAILRNFKSMDEQRRNELIAAVKPVAGRAIKFYKKEA